MEKRARVLRIDCSIKGIKVPVDESGKIGCRDLGKKGQTDTSRQSIEGKCLSGIQYFGQEDRVPHVKDLPDCLYVIPSTKR
jgi:hypothetical protein